MKVNYKDPLLYEHLTMIITEYEEAALKSEKRSGILAVANGPLNAMDSVLEGAERTLQTYVNFHKKRNKISKASTSSTSNADGILGVDIPLVTSVIVDAPDVNESLVGKSDALLDLEDIAFDEDLRDLAGVDNLYDYLKDCLKCNSRLSFKWQIQPVDLTSALNKLLKSINTALDSFEKQMEPLGNIKDLCEILNNTNWLCLPDLVTLLMSIKLLLRSYLTAQLKLNIDWTVLIAPLLKLIVDGIGNLISAIGSVTIGPLDCLTAALKTIAEVQKQIDGIANAAAGIGERVGERAKQSAAFLADYPVVPAENDNIHSNLIYKDVSLDKKNMSLDVSTRTTNKAPVYDAWSFPSGVALDGNVSLPDAITDPRFDSAHWTTKLILTINEAKDFILDLIRKILGSVNSLDDIVSGGLTIQLGNLGMMLFLKDMIALIILLIKLLNSNKGVKDWCTHLQQHPEILEDVLSANNKKIKVSASDQNLYLLQNDIIVGKVQTCLKVNQKDSAMVSTWIGHLNGAS